jgi:hypothetical protein
VTCGGSGGVCTFGSVGDGVCSCFGMCDVCCVVSCSVVSLFFLSGWVMTGEKGEGDCVGVFRLFGFFRLFRVFVSACVGGGVRACVGGFCGGVCGVGCGLFRFAIRLLFLICWVEARAGCEVGGWGVGAFLLFCVFRPSLGFWGGVNCETFGFMSGGDVRLGVLEGSLGL